MASITQPLVWAMVFTAFTGMWTAVEVVTNDIPECTPSLLGVVSCGSLAGAIYSNIALGTVPGAPLMLNAVFALIGLSIRISVTWKILKLIPGVG